MVTAAAVVGSVIGGLLTSYVQPATLRKAFGWFVVLAMAAVVLAQEANIWIGIAVAIVAAIAGTMAFMCAHYARCPLRKVLIDPVRYPAGYHWAIGRGGNYGWRRGGVTDVLNRLRRAQGSSTASSR